MSVLVAKKKILPTDKRSLWPEFRISGFRGFEGRLGGGVGLAVERGEMPDDGYDQWRSCVERKALI